MVGAVHDAVPTADSVPATGLPGGAAAVDWSARGNVTDLVMGDLEAGCGGSMPRPASASSAPGDPKPLFKFSSVRHPIGALPRCSRTAGNVRGVRSGGYADSTGTSWNTHAVPDGRQAQPTNNPPLTETTAASHRR